MGEGTKRAALALVCGVVWGCVFDPAGVAVSTPPDQRVDAPTAEGHAPADGRPSEPATDQQVADSQAPPTDADIPQDTVLPDTTPADTALPDTALQPDTAPVTCDAKYGQAQQYVLCVETSTSCEFYLKTYGSTCTTACISFGGTCLGGYDNDDKCTHVGQSNCNKSLEGQICICSK
jgi:hypothetical protein